MFESFDVDVRVFEELFRMLVTDLVGCRAFVLRIDDRVLEHVDHEVFYSFFVVYSKFILLFFTLLLTLDEVVF